MSFTYLLLLWNFRKTFAKYRWCNPYCISDRLIYNQQLVLLFSDYCVCDLFVCSANKNKNYRLQLLKDLSAQNYLLNQEKS